MIILIEKKIIYQYFIIFHAIINQFYILNQYLRLLYILPRSTIPFITRWKNTQHTPMNHEPNIPKFGTPLTYALNKLTYPSTTPIRTSIPDITSISIKKHANRCTQASGGSPTAYWSEAVHSWPSCMHTTAIVVGIIFLGETRVRGRIILLEFIVMSALVYLVNTTVFHIMHSPACIMKGMQCGHKECKRCIRFTC